MGSLSYFVILNVDYIFCGGCLDVKFERNFEEVIMVYFCYIQGFICFYSLDFYLVWYNEYLFELIEVVMCLGLLFGIIGIFEGGVLVVFFDVYGFMFIVFDEVFFIVYIMERLDRVSGFDYVCIRFQDQIYFVGIK